MKWEEENRGQCSEERTRQDKAGQFMTKEFKEIILRRTVEREGEVYGS